MPGEDIYSWSKIAANNGSADSLINWLEGQARASVNDSARSLMAALAKERDLLNGSIVTAGSANAQTFNTGIGYSAIPTSLRVLLKIGVTNTGSTTLNADATGAVTITFADGRELTGGELLLNSYVYLMYDGTNWILLTTTAASSFFSTGDVKLTLKNVADVGWVLMNDGSIGNVTSGATLASGTTQTLFTLLFTNITDAWAPIQTSVGGATTRAAQASAANAWSNNCRLLLPKVLGRALAVGGSGAGLTARSLGQTAGVETITPSTGNMAPHIHNIGDGVSVAAGGDFIVIEAGLTAVNYPTGSAGSGAAFSIVQPSAFLNVMIKL